MKYLSSLFFLFSVLIIPKILFAQTTLMNQYNNWIFGNNAGINFFGIQPTSITTSSSTTSDYSASISDYSGKLLFYTNGESVWNKKDSIMTNGNFLKGSKTGGQTAMILKAPFEDRSNNLYYIFTVTNYATGGLHYSTVDLDSSNGLGAVINKNVMLNQVSTEKLAAIYHPVNNFYWIITHNWNSNEFACYKLTASGLNPTPIISKVGLNVASGNVGGAHDALGEISVSPDGKKVACAYSYSSVFELYDFDYDTGILSNSISLLNYKLAWGIEFSPDSKKVYTTQWTYNSVNQFDISNYNQTAINNSVTLVGNVTTSNTTYSAGYLELAPDGKIYIAKYGEASLATISSPNTSASNCGFNNNGYIMQSGTCTAGLSNSPAFPPKTTSIFKLENNKQFVFPNPTKNIFQINLASNVESATVYDVCGKVVFFENVLGKSYATFDLQNQPNGIYLIKTSDSSQINIFKIIKE